MTDLTSRLAVLLAEAQAGDQAALDQAVGLLMPVAIRAVRGRCVGQRKYITQDAADMQQEAFLKVRSLILRVDPKDAETMMGLVYVAVDRMVLTRIIRQQNVVLLKDPSILEAPAETNPRALDGIERWPLTSRQHEMVAAYRDAVLDYGECGRKASGIVMRALTIRKAALCRLRQRVRIRLHAWKDNGGEGFSTV